MSSTGTPKDKDKAKNKIDRDLDLANSVRGVWLVKVWKSCGQLNLLCNNYKYTPVDINTIIKFLEKMEGDLQGRQPK